MGKPKNKGEVEEKVVVVEGCGNESYCTTEKKKSERGRDEVRLKGRRWKVKRLETNDRR